MIRRSVCASLFVVVAALGASACEKKPAGGKAAAELVPSRAAATGEFPDNPMLAFVPSDTPYALATFKPVPLEYLHKIGAILGPNLNRLVATYTALAPEYAEQIRAAGDALGSLDVKRIEELGFSAKARFVTYGIGAYPVMRIELSNGDRVFELAQRVATSWKQALPPPTERAGRHYWVVDLPFAAAFVAIAPKELVLAIAPRASIDANLATLLGEQPQAKSLTTAQFRELAERDGFTGQGVGFADLSRIGALIAGATAVDSECSAAIAGVAKRAPRLVIGYDDLTAKRAAFGMVLELAPDLVTDVRSLSGSLVGLDRVIHTKLAMALALAANVDHGRAMLSRVAATVQDLGQRCKVSALAGVADKLSTAATVPLPPAFSGLRAGYVVLTDLKMGRQGPESINGFGSIQLDHTTELLKLASSQVPGFEVSADGKAHALPAMVPFPGHVAASETAIGVALGPNSATTAVDVLQGTAGPAPLAMMVFDYRRFGDLMAASQPGPETENMREIMKLFGVATMQLVVDQRGLVTWMSFELN
jgi:hypothetical protein